MTCECLTGHGHAALAKQSIAVLNGVSQRSVRHAEEAELVLRGRCRAIVRVSWDDHLAEPEAERGIRDSLEAADGRARLARLRPAVLQGYTALVSSLADDPVRRRETRCARTRRRSRTSIRYFDDSILLTETHAWAYYRLPTHAASVERRRHPHTSVPIPAVTSWRRPVASIASTTARPPRQ
jgi:hypothetical protein